MEITFSMIQTLSIAVVVLLVGKGICKHVRFMSDFCIPEAVVGGILFSLLALIGYTTKTFYFNMDMLLKDFFMTCFFTTIGFTASFKLLKKGGFQVIIFLGAATALVIFQDIVGVALAKVFSLHPLIGLSTGSVPMTGGHGTSAAFAPLFEEKGAEGAVTVALACATFGLIMGSMIGGPISKFLIVKNGLITPMDSGKNKETSDDETLKPQTPLKAQFILSAFFQICIAMGIGSLISILLEKTGLTFPGYIGAMFAAAVMRNISDAKTKVLDLRLEEIGILGDLFLSIFLSMALMSLQLWELAALAVPLVIMLLAQTVLMALFSIFITFNVMGKDYDAAVLTAGHCGFGMGATPNAVANMNALSQKHGYSAKAFFILPIVGSLFIDFVNVSVITFFMNIV